MRILASLLLLLGLSSCLITPHGELAKYKSAEDLVKRSQVLVKQQHWGEAQNLLKRGVMRFPDDQSLQKTLAEVTVNWKNRNIRLENWMLVYETEGLLLKRPLLITMSESDPGDYHLESRLSNLRAMLRNNRRMLISCVEQHIDNNLRLAKRCIEAASIIFPSDEADKLANRVTQKVSGVKKRKQQKAKISSSEARKDKIKEARNLLEEQAYNRVINLLQPLLLLNSDDHEVNILMDEAITGRNLQVLRLIRLGDQLYKEEHIQQALKVWERAASLYPENMDIKSRVDRARKVLDSLQEIRSGEKDQL